MQRSPIFRVFRAAPAVLVPESFRATHAALAPSVETRAWSHLTLQTALRDQQYLGLRVHGRLLLRRSADVTVAARSPADPVANLNDGCSWSMLRITITAAPIRPRTVHVGHTSILYASALALSRTAVKRASMTTSSAHFDSRNSTCYRWRHTHSLMNTVRKEGDHYAARESDAREQLLRYCAERCFMNTDHTVGARACYVE